MEYNFNYSYKVIENDIIIALGQADELPQNCVEITKEKYNSLMNVIANAPTNTLEYIYRLSNTTEMYESFERTHDETVEWYVQQITSGTITLEEVPEEYRTEVEANINAPEPVDPRQSLIDELIAEVNK